MRTCNHVGKWTDMPCPDPECLFQGTELTVPRIESTGISETRHRRVRYQSTDGTRAYWAWVAFEFRESLTSPWEVLP